MAYQIMWLCFTITLRSEMQYLQCLKNRIKAAWYLDRMVRNMKSLAKSAGPNYIVVSRSPSTSREARVLNLPTLLRLYILVLLTATQTTNNPLVALTVMDKRKK